VQVLHARHGGVADVDARLDQIAQFQQPDAEPVGAGLVAFGEAARAHRREDAVRGRRVQAGFLGEVLEAHRLVIVGQDIEQLHHAVDDLDRGLALRHVGCGDVFAMRNTIACAPWRPAGGNDRSVQR